MCVWNRRKERGREGKWRGGVWRRRRGERGRERNRDGRMQGVEGRNKRGKHKMREM